jgi:putative spermidine/putrescine transport system permease protein
MSVRERGHAVPVRWRLLDAVERVAAAVWPPAVRGLTGWLLLLPALLLVGLLAVGLLWVAEYSLHELDPATYMLREDYSLANYGTVFGQRVYIDIVLRSAAAAAIVTAVTLILAFPYAYVMVRTARPWVRKALLVSLFLPFFIGQVVRAYGWLILLGKQGLINQALAALGLEPMNLLFNYNAVLLGLVQYMLPFAVLMLAPALTAIPEEVEQASESLGATWVQTFLHVVIPMAKPGLVGAAVVVFTLTITDFAMPEILGGGTIDFIANAIYDGFFQIANAGLGSALAVVLVAIGTTLVGLIFAGLGAGTLSFVSRRG